MMDANYIYDIFETSEEYRKQTGNPVDLNTALAMLQATKPIPDGMDAKSLSSFLAHRSSNLSAAYQTHDRDYFAEIVARAEGRDTESAE